jgi:hypothetical protein
LSLARYRIVLLLGMTLCPLMAKGQVLFSSDFQTTSSSGFIVRDNTSVAGQSPPDGSVTFGYDYVAAGIGLAPNSGPLGGRGLRIAANESAMAADHYTVFKDAPVSTSYYRVSVDLFMGVDPEAAGTTEFGMIGVGSDGTFFNSIFTPVSGDGHFVALTGDGGSSSDYRHYTPLLGSVGSGDSSYLDPSNTTNGTGVLYQTILPGGDFPGSPGNRWVTLTVDVTPATITYAINGTDIIRTVNEDSDGLVSLGYADLFSSVGPHFGIFDNLSVIVRSAVIDPTVNNGDFETGLLPPWDAGGNSALVSVSSTYAQSGTFSLAVDSAGAVPFASPGAFQENFAASAGEVWNFSGYILTPATIGDSSFGLLKIVFKDAEGNDLVPEEATRGFIEANPDFPGIETTPRVTAATPAEEWIYVEAEGRAPSGTASVQLFALNVNEGVAPSVMYFDNLVATQTPVTSRPVVEIQVEGVNAFLAQESDSSREYIAEASSDLAFWTPFATILGNDAEQVIRVPGGAPVSGGKTFYQIASEPPPTAALALGVEVLVNADFTEGDDSLDGWEAYAFWEQPKGTFGAEGPWALSDAPVRVFDFPQWPWNWPEIRTTFSMNAQLAAEDPFWEGAYQNGMSFQQAFWTPDGPQAGNVVNLYGKLLTFSGDLGMIEAYSENAIVSVAVTQSTVLPGEANQVYGPIPTLFSNLSETGCVVSVTRDATGAVETVKVLDPGSDFSLDDEIIIPGTAVGGGGSDDIRLRPTELADSTVEVFVEFLDASFFPVAPSVAVEVTSQPQGVAKPFSIQATCPPSDLSVVIVGFRNRGIEGTAGTVGVGNLSLIASEP